MSDNGVSYFFGQVEKDRTVYCKICNRNDITAFIQEGQLFLRVLTKYARYHLCDNYHWECIPHGLLKEVLRETTKQAILNDCFLDEECKTKIQQAIDEEEISITKQDDNPAILKKKLKSKIGCLDPFRGSKTALKRHGYYKTISKKKKKKMRRQVNNELSKMFGRMDLGLLGSRASSVNSDSDLDLLEKFECLGIKTEDSQEL